MSGTIALLGWEAHNLRCPDHKIELSPSRESKPFRVTLIQMPNGTGKTTTLIEWGWYREDCVNAIQSAHLPTPRKNSCFFCPASKKAEVIALSQEHPDLYQRAVELERRARPNLHVIRGLGRHWSWEELVNLKSTDISALSETPDMPCLCVDESTDD